MSIIFILRVNKTSVDDTKRSSDCFVVNEGKNEKVNVVFLPYGYSDNKKFLSDIDMYINGEFGFKNLEPFKSNFENINFYSVMDSNVKCDVVDNTIICDELSTRSAASRCPNDYIIVLYDRDSIKDFIVPIRSSAYLNLASINTADDPLVVPHEFVHICCNLADEYVEEGITIDLSRFENCDVETCPRWNFFNGTGCYQGCGEINFYRSIETGIMRNYLIGKEYGSWNEYLISRYIQ
ncbi:hypothetical protein J4455_04130 [Candidatus Woesearchaeota archaeon]|nr:hypothetical protein [Candidatus Woesearchaeota archaeon]